MNFDTWFRNIQGKIKLIINGVKVEVVLRPQDYFIVYEVLGERVYEKLLSHPILEGEVVLDIGAHIGMASLFFATALPKAKIVSIEPSKENFNILCHNLNQVRNVTIQVNAALASKSGEVDFFVSEYMQSNGSILPDVRKLKTSVSSLSLDDLIDKYQPVCVKFDIEGGEEKIFESSTKFSIPQMWMGEIETNEARKILHKLFSSYHVYEEKRIGRFAYVLFSQKSIK